LAADIVFVGAAMALMLAVALVALVQSARSKAVVPKQSLRSVVIVGIVFLIGLAQELRLRTASGDVAASMDDLGTGLGQVAFSLAAAGFMVHLLVGRGRYRKTVIEEIGIAESLVSSSAVRAWPEGCVLTGREREVLDAMRSGALADSEIAEALYISRATAATHIRNILKKTGLHDRGDLLLIDPSDGGPS